MNEARLGKAALLAICLMSVLPACGSGGESDIGSGSDAGEIGRELRSGQVVAEVVDASGDTVHLVSIESAVVNVNIECGAYILSLSLDHIREVAKGDSNERFTPISLINGGVLTGRLGGDLQGRSSLGRYEVPWKHVSTFRVLHPRESAQSTSGDGLTIRVVGQFPNDLLLSSIEIREKYNQNLYRRRGGAPFAYTHKTAKRDVLSVSAGRAGWTYSQWDLPLTRIAAIRFGRDMKTGSGEVTFSSPIWGRKSVVGQFDNWAVPRTRSNGSFELVGSNGLGTWVLDPRGISRRVTMDICGGAASPHDITLEFATVGADPRDGTRRQTAIGACVTWDGEEYQIAGGEMKPLRVRAGHGTQEVEWDNLAKVELLRDPWANNRGLSPHEAWIDARVVLRDGEELRAEVFASFGFVSCRGDDEAVIHFRSAALQRIELYPL